jgi:8-oxo-dGTP pyrophosphatase MutT (NUDIX family)
VTVADGGMRWGRYGAAGILVRHTGSGEPWYFLARRSMFTHRGGTWAIPGGALDEGEDPVTGALREFFEETGLELGDHEIAHTHEDDHGGWTYWTIVVDVAEQFGVPETLNWETSEARWVHADELGALQLFDAFEATLLHIGLLRPASADGDATE